MRCSFIRQQKKAYPVSLMCRVMGVSRSGLYTYLQHAPKSKTSGQFELEAAMLRLFNQSGKTYGSRRMAKGLQAMGFAVGRRRARTLMQRLGLIVKTPRRYKATTESKHNYPVAPNLLNREFSVARPDRVWVSDITCLWTREGWLYLAIILDLFSRKIVGWAMSDRIKASLVENALNMACFRRKPGNGLIFHADRGTQIYQ
jgi:putative transposase